MIILIAEAGINANGSIDLAKKLIDVAADAGCHYVKFQKRDIDSVYTKAELDAPRESPWGKTNREQKQGLEFSVDQYKIIDEYCKTKNIGWFVSCWDLKSVDLMEQYFPDMPFHKVPSALLTDRAFLEKLKSTGRPVILSTGMSTEDQILAACDILGPSLKCVMHCTSTYPTKPEEMNINYIGVLQTIMQAHAAVNKTEEIPVGFSSHYSGIAYVPAVLSFDIAMLEFHITLDRTMYGSDQAASLEKDAVKKICDYAKIVPLMMGDGVKKVYDSEKPIIAKLRKKTDF